jgi:TolB protein
MRHSLWLALAVAVTGTGAVAAQDSTNDRVRVVVGYVPGARPGLVVLPGPGLDSVRAIVRRDLEYSDRFQMVAVGSTNDPGGTVNYGVYKSLGAELAVELLPAAGGVTARLHDVGSSRVRNEQFFAVPGVADRSFRMDVHRLSDEVTRWASGSPGYAASRLLFVSRSDKRVYRIDSDGNDLVAQTPSGVEALSPVWSPDAQRIAYTKLVSGRAGPLVVQTLASGAMLTVPGTESGQNITPAFSPDGRMLAYGHMTEQGTDLYTVNVADRCCNQRLTGLTGGHFADNLSPTYSPDGQSIAFISTRAGSPQVYTMSADGTGQELLADYGKNGSSNAPEWSPDRAKVAFHREVSGSAQLFVIDVANRRIRQLTSVGRNEDPTWAPDGRHLAFVSTRSGRSQLWIIDIDTGTSRQIVTPGTVRLPAWSRRFGGP